ncbi:nuclear transport factor 2 family protein [Streptomyces xanthochromogenes]|uniref:nuclear transport factor 2 family protein n=1 Tax=Streptomyces xanthochromogenes TaxID=67384 RepID=UPI003412CD27
MSGTGLSGSGQKDAHDVWSAVTGLYAAHGTGEVDGVDGRLDPEATMWHSEAEGLLRGKGDLDSLRAERAMRADGPQVTDYYAHDPVIDLSGHMAVVCYWLRVDYALAQDGTALSPELVRNTAVLRRSVAGWRIVHLHEEVRVAGGRPVAADEAESS